MYQKVSWILDGLMLALATVISLWMTGAIYYDVCGGIKWARVIAWGWIAGVALLFILWHPVWQPFLTLLCVAGLFVIWWLGQKPSHHRDWDPCVGVLPQATTWVEVVTIENVRNFEYRTLSDYTLRYETRSFSLANLRGGDIIFFNWGSPWMCHPVLVYDFGGEGRICISIEVRYRKGQDYSIIRSLYRQQELIIVAADERDIILRRTKYAKNQTAHLYNVKLSIDAVRTAFIDTVWAINDLYKKPRWYHGLTMNCTTSYYWLPNSRTPLAWQVIINGRIPDQAFYELRPSWTGAFRSRSFAAPFIDQRYRQYAAPEAGSLVSFTLRRETLKSTPMVRSTGTNTSVSQPVF